MDMLDDGSSVNMELRMLTLELMKIAIKQKRQFKDVAIEYIKNAMLLKTMLENCSFERVDDVTRTETEKHKVKK